MIDAIDVVFGQSHDYFKFYRFKDLNYEDRINFFNLQLKEMYNTLPIVRISFLVVKNDIGMKNVLGFFYLNNFNKPSNGIGYIIIESEKGRGYGTRALRMLLNFLDYVEQYGSCQKHESCIITIDPNNFGSKIIATRNGFNLLEKNVICEYGLRDKYIYAFQKISPK
jgi:RimJ/RimL family protein N-acetyltransferase